MVSTVCISREPGRWNLSAFTGRSSWLPGGKERICRQEIQNSRPEQFPHTRHEKLMGCIGIWVGAPSSHTCVAVESTCARVDNGRGAWQVRYFVRIRSTRAGSLAVWQSGSAVEMWYGVSSLTVAAMMFDSVLDAVVNSRRVCVPPARCQPPLVSKRSTRGSIQVQVQVQVSQPSQLVLARHDPK